MCNENHENVYLKLSFFPCILFATFRVKNLNLILCDKQTIRLKLLFTIIYSTNVTRSRVGKRRRRSEK